MIQILTFVTAVFLVVVDPSSAYADDARYDPAPLISEVLEDLDEIKLLVDELHSTDPNSRWFSRSRVDIQEDLDVYLDALISHIVDIDYGEAREKLLSADVRISEINRLMDDIRIELINARPSAEIITRVDSLLMRDLAPGSREALEARLADLEQEVSTLQREMRATEQDFARLLSSQYDIDLSIEQVRSVLYQINGRSIVEASVAFSVLQSVEARLGEIRVAATSQETLRRYYGVAAIMRLISVRIHELHLQDYRQTWLPSLDRFETQNMELIIETQDLIEEATSEAAINRLNANLRIQEQIERVIEDYRRILVRRQRIEEQRFEAASEDATLAVNTLRTLSQAAILFDQFSWPQDESNALMSAE